MDVEFVRHTFEDGHDGVVVKSKFKLGVRHLQMLYMLTCAATMGAMRASTPVAVIAMCDVNRQNDTYIKVYDWTPRAQGQILSLYFLGYAVMVLPAEIYLKRFSGKLLLSMVLLINGAFALAMPFIAGKAGWLAVFNAHLWLGMTQACLSPANQALLTNWVPPSERKFCSSVVHAGTIIGIAVGLPVSGVLTEARLGWELVFYAQAMMTLSMAVVWTILTASTPSQHQAIGDTEKEFIDEALGYYRERAIQVPWRSILRCKQYWAAVCAHAAANAVFVFYLTMGPAYLQQFGVSFRYSCSLSVIPIVVLWRTHQMTSPTLEWICRLLQQRFRFNIGVFRKFINTLGVLGVVSGLLMMSRLTPEWRTLAMVLLSGTAALIGFQYSGFLETCKDMSQNFPGSLLTLSRAVASAAGALVPVLVAPEVVDPSHWQPLFLTLSGVYLACNIAYTMVGSSRRQQWDGGAVVKAKFGYQNQLIDNNAVELEELGALDVRPEKVNPILTNASL